MPLWTRRQCSACNENLGLKIKGNKKQPTKKQTTKVKPNQNTHKLIFIKCKDIYLFFFLQKDGGRVMAASHYFAYKSHLTEVSTFLGTQELPCCLSTAVLCSSILSGSCCRGMCRKPPSGQLQEKPVQIQHFLPAPQSVSKNWLVLKHGGLRLLKCFFKPFWSL